MQMLPPVDLRAVGLVRAIWQGWMRENSQRQYFISFRITFSNQHFFSTRGRGIGSGREVRLLFSWLDSRKVCSRSAASFECRLYIFILFCAAHVIGVINSKYGRIHVSQEDKRTCWALTNGKNMTIPCRIGESLLVQNSITSALQRFNVQAQGSILQCPPRVGLCTQTIMPAWFNTAKSSLNEIFITLLNWKFE